MRKPVTQSKAIARLRRRLYLDGTLQRAQDARMAKIQAEQKKKAAQEIRRGLQWRKVDGVWRLVL